MELAFLQTVKLFISRNDLANAVKTAKTLFKRKKDSSQRAAILEALSDWMCGRFGYKNWAVDFFRPKYLGNSLLVCKYLSEEFGESVPKKLWVTFGDFIFLCIGPMHKFNTYKQVEELGAHMTRWRPNNSRAWLIYSDLLRRCIGHLSVKRQVEAARTFPKAYKTAANNEDRLILRYRYTSFHRIAKLHNEALETIPPPTKAELRKDPKLASNLVHERALIFIGLRNLEREHYKKWSLKALEALQESCKISPDIMKRSEMLVQLASIQISLGMNDDAIQSYFLAVDHLEMKTDLEHRWSHLVANFLDTIQEKTKGSIPKFRQKLSERSKKRATNCEWMFKRLGLLLQSIEAWSLDNTNVAISALVELKGLLSLAQKNIIDQLTVALSAKERNNAFIKERYKALAMTVHLR
ncbi:MAG: hypothetical protein P1V97_14405 [Planctomycetota bacterium]|nr:hypothetical protein [Planctomycetota bacterium]